mmetsp:Transcript_22604/g.33967  ORF Transcript_22604/g.33967 Transcript_22604/m.33967 type:complete len:465 (-) Transcript_22604:818-2212(-)
MIRPTKETRCFKNPNILPTASSAQRAPTTTMPLTDDTANSNLPDPAIFEQQMQKYLHKYLIPHLDNEIRQTRGADSSVYTGAAGIAYTFAQLSLHHPTVLTSVNLSAKKCFEISRKKLEEAEKEYVSSSDIACSLLCGRAGLICTKIMLSAGMECHDETSQPPDKIVPEYLSLLNGALECDSDEWLYGRAGYLHGLLAIRPYSDTNTKALVDGAIDKIVRRIIVSGTSYARRCGSRSPLMYQWYGEEYLGAAHGVFGIVQQLLLARPALVCVWPHNDLADFDKLVRGTLDYLQDQQIDKPFGNYPPCRGEKDDHLVHFCHGAPGAVFTFLSAHSTYSDTNADDRYLNMACDLAECIWRYGLLRKGPGLCHGIAGNAYCFLALQREDHSNSRKWIRRAAAMASFMDTLPQDKDWLLRPDHPMSLFEGLSGTVLFLADLISALRGMGGDSEGQPPFSPSFPLYELP